MSVCLLGEDVRCRLRSGVALTSVAQCVGELVENSIDAEAYCVAVRVDLTKFKIQVVDNGHGIARKDLDLIGQRYVTSKCHTLHDLENNLHHFGYRGEALASIVDTTGTVEVTSRHRHSQQTYFKMFYHGHPSPVTQSSSGRPSVGTTVTLHDLFYNVPVRRKALSEAIEIENIWQMLRGLALANPSVSFSLRNDAVANYVMQIKKTGTLLGTFSVLFGLKRSGSMKEVCHRRGSFGISGIVSVESHYSKSLQFFLVNGRLVKKTALHACVNSALSNSLICRTVLRRCDSSKWPAPLEGGRDTASPRRTPDKYGIYVLKLECPRTEYDICLEPAKTLVEFKDWDTVLDILRETIGTFLRRYSLNLGLENLEEGNARKEGQYFDENQSSSYSEEMEVLKFGQELGRKPLSHDEPAASLAACSDAGEADVPDINEENSSDASIECAAMDVNHQEPSLESSVLVKVHQRDSVEVSRCRVGGEIGYTRSPLHSRSLASKLSWLLERKEGADVSLKESAVGEDGGRKTLEQGKQEKGSDRCSSEENTKSLCDRKQRLLSGCDRSLSMNGPLNLILPKTTAVGGEAVQGDNVWHHRRYGATFLSSASSRGARPLPATGTEVSDGSEGRTDQDKECCVEIIETILQEDLQLVDSHHHLSTDSGVNSWNSKYSNSADSTDQLCNLSGSSKISKNMSSSLLISEKAAPMSNTPVQIDDNNRVSKASAMDTDIDLSDSNITLSSSPWVEKTDPMTGRKIYVHKRTGNTSTVAPWKPKDVNKLPSNVPYKDSNMSPNSSLCTGSAEVPHSSYSNSYGSRPLEAAPHLSYDFHRFAPSAKRLRLSGSSSLNVKKVASSYVGERSGAKDGQRGGHLQFEGVDNMVGLESNCSNEDLDTAQKIGDRVTSTACKFNNRGTSTSCVDFKGCGMEGQWMELSNGQLDVGGETFGIGDQFGSVEGECESRFSLEVEGKGEGREVKVAASEWEEGSFNKLLESWTNPAFLAGQQEITSISSGSRAHIKVHNIIHGYKFTKDMFKSIQVLGQVDRKFIACVADISGNGKCDVVVLFDQHAAHERVRLEDRLSDLYESSDGKSKVKSSQVQPPLTLNLTSAQVDLCRHFRAQFEALGITLVHGVGGAVGVASVPAVLIQREASEVIRGRPSVALELVQELVEKHLEVLKDTSGGSQVIPASLTNILHSQACRSAIKFGDALTLSECQELIQSLSTCKLPFQCAHGRPSLVPILDLRILKKKYPNEVESRNLSKKLSELYHHKIS